VKAGMTRYYQRAIKDILENRFLTSVTVITIALSILIASAFALFFINAGEVLNVWKKGIRVMVYLKPDTSEAARLDTKFRLQGIAGVQEAQYISKQEALERLKEQMKHHSALLDSLKTNPLPDAFEIILKPQARNSTELEFLAERIAGLPAVAEVEYGQQWIQRFSNIINLFSLAGYAIGGLFFMAAVFIVANTIRLVLYSRRDEIDIMRLVGATDRFIKFPFYLEGMIQGGLGSLLGLLVLLAGYYAMAAHFQQSIGVGVLSLRFFSPGVCVAIVLGGVVVGWLGCLISLKQFMKA
jgi:cell division transport system permease protein